MSRETRRPVTRDQLRTPRMAAYAGLVFAILNATSMLLFQLSIPLDRPYQTEWLDDGAGRVRLAVALVPFSGIAFLWFMGVIRDRIGNREDRLFSTVYVGSGLLMLGGLFVWAALIGATLASAEADPDSWPRSGAFVFGMSMVETLGGVMTLRMAAVFMFSTSAVWLRTSVMPRWLVWITWVLAITLLIGGGAARELRFVFPLWVCVVSLFVLRVNGELADRD